jgi:hypothetical protein
MDVSSLHRVGVVGLLAWLAGCAPEEPGNRARPQGGGTVDTGDTDAPDDTGDTGPAPEPACIATRFAALGEAWTLPGDLGDDAFPSLHGGVTEGGAWRPVRIDGKPALLVLGAAPALGEALTPGATLYVAEGAGFGAPARYDLPASLDVAKLGEEPPDAEAPRGDGVVAGVAAPGEAAWWLQDLDGDGTTDLLVAGDEAAPGWTFHAGSAVGLADGVPWRMPEELAALVGTGQADMDDRDGVDGWRVDMDGDGLQDVFVLRPATTTPSGGSGAAIAQVYRNTGSGFAEAAEWAVPETLATGMDTGRHALVDLDGDHRPDFVGAPAAPGPAGWQVHRNTGTGFEAGPVTLALPDGYPEGTFDDPHGGMGRDVAWSLRDLDGDGVADIVVTWDARSAEEPDTAATAPGPVGTARWMIHAGTPGLGGFAPAADFLLPTGFPEATFENLDAAAETSPAWGLADLDTDGTTDLVVTAWDRGPEDGIGTTSWRLYRGVCEVDPAR